MKKQIFLIISLFVAYYSYGQTHSICKDAFYITSDFETIGDEQKTYWLYFTSKSNFLRIYLDKAPNDVSCYLYAGDCEKLNLLEQSNFNFLSYYKLNIGEKYFVKIESNKLLEKVDIYFSNQSNDDMVSIASMCEEVDSCNKIANGDFSQTIGQIDYTNPFSSGNIQGWATLTHQGSPFLVDGSPVLYTDSLSQESIITCTELNENQIYLIKFDYKKEIGEHTAPYFYDLKIDISTNEIDNFQGQEQVSNINNVDIENIVSVNLSSTVNTGEWYNYYGFFQPTQNNTRLFMYAESSIGSRTLFDNIQIIPLEYQDTIYACTDTIKVFPKCLESALNFPYHNNLDISWQADNGVIIEGGNTLTPMINTIGNPLLTLNITYNGATYSKSIQVQPNEGQQVVDFSCMIDNATCNHHNGNIDVTVEGGTAPYTFEWSMTGLDTVVAVIENAPATGGDLENIPQGSYALTVTSSEGCQVYKNKIDVGAINIRFDVDTFSTPPNEHCGALKAVNISSNAVEPYTYQWQNASGEIVGTTQLVTGLPAGNYSVTLTDANNCQAFKMARITNNTNALGVIEDDTIYVCQGSTFSFGVSEAYDSYLWNTGETTNSINLNNVGNVNGDPYGDYTCNYKTESGCRFEKTFHILPPVLNIDVDKIGNTCKPNMVSSLERLNISATPDYTNYQWSYRTFTNNGFNLIPIPMNINGNAGVYTFSNYNSGYIVIYLTADVPNSDCQVSASTKIYIGESITNNTLLTNNWQDQNLYVFTDIILADGQTHEINNCHIEFAPECGIKVQGVGTRLKIRNSEIEGMFCADALWDGIAVEGPFTGLGHWGTPYPMSRNANAQNENASLEISSSTISGAHTAVTAMGGAILKLNNSNCINNNRSVNLFYKYTPSFPMPYGNTEVEIKNCNFEVNEESRLISGFGFDKFINVSQLMAFNINGNHFINKCYEQAYDERGIAIEVYETHSVKLFNNNRFERMSNAVKLNNVNYFESLNNTFKNNYRGISAEYLNYSSSFIGNIFDDAYLKQENSACQISLSRCKKPYITENTFKNGVVGIYLDNENYGNFQIYKNTFEGFNLYSNILNGYPTAILNDANNGTFGSTPKGLEVKCNTFKKYDYAIAIQKGSIKQTQGSNQSNQSPAGNRFLDDINMPDGNFFISEEAQNEMDYYNYKYFYHQSPEECDLGSTYRYTQPLHIYANKKGVKKKPTGFAFDEVASCPSQSSAPSTRIFNQQKDSINQQQSLISDKKQDLANKIDKGNTDVLLAEIDMATDANFAALVQEIESVNAYLSDETAIEFIEKPTNRQVAKAVGLIANSPLPEQAKKRLPDMDMDEDLKAYIYAHQTGTSKRELDEQRIYQLETKKEALIDQSIRMAYSDTSNVLFPQVIELLLEQNDFDSQLMAYRMLSAKNEQEQAQMVFNDLELMLTPFEEAHQEHLQNYLELLQWQNSLDTLSDSLMVERIKSNRALLEQIKNSNYTEGHSEAYYLLQKAGLLPKDKLAIQLPNPHQRAQNRALNRQPIKALPKSHFKQLADRLEVYPNPVADILTVEYIMFNGLRVNTMGIYDMNGHLLQTHPITKAMGVITIDVKALPSGTYIIAFGTEGSASGTPFIVK